MEKKTKKLKNSGDAFLSQLFETNCMLDLEDLDQIRTRYNAGFYVLGAQFVWRKFRILVKDFISSTVKPELIDYLTFCNATSRPSPFARYDFEMLYMFGMITKKQKLELTKTLKNSQHFEDAFYQMSQTAFENLLELCFTTFFSKNKEELVKEYYQKKEELCTMVIADNPDLLKFLSNKKYPYYTTAIRTLLYSYETDPTNTVIENNLIYLVGNFWNKMTYNDKLFLGYLAGSTQKPQCVKDIAKQLLSQGEELSYISDSKNIDEIVDILQRTKCAFYGYKGDGLLMDCLSELSKKVIPIKYSSMYLSDLFLAAFGGNDEQMDMQSSIVKIMLDKVDVTMYRYYFDFCMRYDEDVLLILSTNKMARSLFCEHIKNIDPKVLATTDKQIEKLLLSAITGDTKDIQQRSKELLK